jgi:hypothetical protein
VSTRGARVRHAWPQRPRACDAVLCCAVLCCSASCALSCLCCAPRTCTHTHTHAHTYTLHTHLHLRHQVARVTSLARTAACGRSWTLLRWMAVSVLRVAGGEHGQGQPTLRLCVEWRGSWCRPCCAVAQCVHVCILHVIWSLGVGSKKHAARSTVHASWWRVARPTRVLHALHQAHAPMPRPPPPPGVYFLKWDDQSRFRDLFSMEWCAH